MRRNGQLWLAQGEQGTGAFAQRLLGVRCCARSCGQQHLARIRTGSFSIVLPEGNAIETVFLY